MCLLLWNIINKSRSKTYQQEGFCLLIQNKNYQRGTLYVNIIYLKRCISRNKKIKLFQKKISSKWKYSKHIWGNTALLGTTFCHWKQNVPNASGTTKHRIKHPAVMVSDGQWWSVTVIDGQSSLFSSNSFFWKVSHHWVSQSVTVSDVQWGSVAFSGDQWRSVMISGSQSSLISFNFIILKTIASVSPERITLFFSTRKIAALRGAFF